ncbi:SWIM zinc finger domain-containing protein [Caballeronia sp. RCC_10]|uniref:SWIM zinc finger family protein n=1 Tax=Caballeronia sp. RCC_10 TaxID=3239227 RepID=UPI003526B2AC
MSSSARGKAYFHDGAVSRLDERNGVLSASVNGTSRYSVELKVGRDDELAYVCDCPVGQTGTFCKHLVAVALSWLENAGDEVVHAVEREPTKPRKKRKTSAAVSSRCRQYRLTVATTFARHFVCVRNSPLIVEITIRCDTEQWN